MDTSDTLVTMHTNDALVTMYTIPDGDENRMRGVLSTATNSVAMASREKERVRFPH